MQSHRANVPCPLDTTGPYGCRIECTSVMSGLGGAPAALPGVDAGRCRRRTGRGSGRCGGTAGPRSGRPGRGGVGPFAWVPADLGYGGREARRSSVWRAWPSARVARDLRENGGAPDGVRALPAKGKNFSFRGCIRRPMGHPPGPTTCTAGRGAPPLRKKVVSSQRTTKAKARRSHSLPLLTYSGLGGLRQDPGRAAESAAGPRTDEDMGGTTCVCCCRPMGDAVTSDRWWDWRCGCGRWARRCGCARRPTGRSGRPTRQREGSER